MQYMNLSVSMKCFPKMRMMIDEQLDEIRALKEKAEHWQEMYFYTKERLKETE